MSTPTGGVETTPRPPLSPGKRAEATPPVADESLFFQIPRHGRRGGDFPRPPSFPRRTRRGLCSLGSDARREGKVDGEIAGRLSALDVVQRRRRIVVSTRNLFSFSFSVLSSFPVRAGLFRRTPSPPHPPPFFSFQRSAGGRQGRRRPRRRVRPLRGAESPPAQHHGRISTHRAARRQRVVLGAAVSPAGDERLRRIYRRRLG